MGRRSFFFKDYVAHLVLIVCAFALAGVVFCYQMSSYALHAKQTELRTTVQSLAEQSKLLEGTDSDVIRQIYMLSIARVAKEDELTVLITDADGNIEMGAKPDGTTYTLPGYHISAEVVAEMHKNGSYASVGSLGVLSESSFYTVGTCVKDDNGDADLMIFVSTQDPNSAGVVRHSTQTLVLIMLVTLVVMLVISFMISQHVTRPLKTIAAAAKEFAGGNFDVRVPEDNRCYEIDELAVSFNNMARDLDQLEELTRGFISNVSHEFKTPMTTIAGYTDGILDGTIPPEQEQQYLRIISDEARRLSRLVRRMLEVSQLQSRDLTRTKAPFDVCESMRRVLISMEKKITDRGLDVDADIPDSGIMVLGDNDLITQVIYNLLENAAKFARKGSALYLGVTTLNGKALISVRNEGDTIPAEEIPLLFERFHKSDKSRSEDKDGVGLGLYVVKTILDQHKEHIAVTSENGLTTFTFSVTLAGGQTAQ